jgi:hypothetical protein
MVFLKAHQGVLQWTLGPTTENSVSNPRVEEFSGFHVANSHEPPRFMRSVERRTLEGFYDRPIHSTVFHGKPCGITLLTDACLTVWSIEFPCRCRSHLETGYLHLKKKSPGFAEDRSRSDVSSWRRGNDSSAIRNALLRVSLERASNERVGKDQNSNDRIDFRHHAAPALQRSSTE